MDYAECRYSISTHDLTRRSTQHSRRQAHQNWYFNSRPHEEVDSRQIANPHIIIDFNSRPHEKVDMLPESVSLSGEAFQLTTSRGGRRQVVVVVILPLIFQLTTSRGGRPQFLRKKFSFLNHFLCLLHIIYSYYINTIFFSTLFFAKS